MVSVSRVPTSAQSPWHCLSPPGLPTLSSSSLPNLHSPPLSSSLPRPGSGLPTSAQSSVYHPPPATQLYYRPPITSQPIKVTFPIKLLFFSPYNFQRADNFHNDWLTYYRSCWKCGCECGPGPQCCLQDWDTQREESVTSETEGENGGQRVGCSGQPPTHHTPLWSKTWVRVKRNTSFFQSTWWIKKFKGN